MKKKVAIITNIPSPYRVDFFYYLQKHYKDFDIFIIYTGTNEDNREWHINKSKIKNSIFAKSKVIKLNQKLDVKYIHIPHNIGKILTHLKTDIVIGMEYNPSALQAFLWCKIHHKKFIHWTDGTLNSEKDINKIQYISRKIIINHADAYIASSTKAKEKLLFYGAPENKVIISLLTVDLNNYKKICCHSMKNRILYVGRISFGKGLDLLLEALTKVEHKFELHIVGDGPERRTIAALVQKMNLEKQVVFEGFKENEELIQCYRECDVFVFPSRQDCFGLVILEALCAGLPVIASRYADGVYDTIIEDTNGYIVDPYDADEMAQKIDMALDHELRLSGNCSIELGKFRMEAVASCFMEAISSVL